MERDDASSILAARDSNPVVANGNGDVPVKEMFVRDGGDEFEQRELIKNCICGGKNCNCSKKKGKKERDRKIHVLL